LTRPLDRHLDGDELDALLMPQALGVSPSGRLSEEALREAQRHIESCQDCDRKVQMHRSAQNAISLRATSGQARRGTNCSEETEWVRVAAGLLEEDEAKELMRHAAQCGHCGPLLKAAVKGLSDEATPDEEAEVAKLGSARPDWQAQMARTLRSAGGSRRSQGAAASFWKSVFYWPRPAFVAAAAIILMAAAWVGVRMLRPMSAAQLLAQSYAERRSMEVRIPGAKHAPMRVERSGANSSFDKLQSLLKAEALISEKLGTSPNDPAWLDAKARAEMLDGSYDDAIKTLQHALETQPESSELMIDLGSAYFMRGESSGRPIDYGNAIESLGKALAKSPNDPIALFNRALSCERLFLYTQAVDDWEHYLRIDPQGEWANEARQRLASVQQKLKQHEKSQSESLLNPDYIAHQSANDSAVRGQIDDRIEQYLHIAVTNWLPQAFSETSELRATETRAALSKVADIAQKEHDDTWLAELLSKPGGAEFSEGIKSLSASVRANDMGDYAQGQELAHRAVLKFREAANAAGELRAQAEEVYSDHLLWEGPRCLALISTMNQLLSHRSYGWIQGQMSLEQSNCANAVGDLGTYQAAIGRGMKQASDHKYIALYLRALGFQALSDASVGESTTAFSLAAQGLSLFWSRPIDLMKGYNLYFNLESTAEGLHLPYLEVVLLRQATALIDQHPDVLQRAMAHRWYANAAYSAHMPELASLEFSKASSLFASSPRTAATTRDYMDAEVWLAHVEIEQGDVEQANARLKTIKGTLDESPSFDPEIGFYSAQAEIAMRRADSSAAESAIRSAVFLAEWALNSYRSEGDRRQWAEQTRDTYREAVEWKLRQGDATSALELWEWYRGAELRANEGISSHRIASRETDTPPDPGDAPELPTPTAVANRLGSLRDETVIVYGTFADGISIWVYDDRGVFSRWVSTSESSIQELALRFGRLCSDPTSSLVTVQTTARLLYDMLVAPIEDRLVPGRTIIIEPDDILPVISWEALVDSRSHYLAERAAVVVAPGLYRTMHLRSATVITRDTPVLIVSVPSADGFTPLTDANNEAQAVATNFSSPRWLQDRDATLSAIRRGIRDISVFHFAGHAIASPLRSGLVLAELDSDFQHPRLVGAESFPARDVGTLQLVVLSACHTNGEGEVGGSGTESLTDALLHAGVPHVIASRWNVDSRETAELMQQFYSHLLAGSDVANAMHAAELALASHPASAHPYYWAAFELRGER